MLHEPQNLREVFDGGGPVMWPLLGASVIAVAVIIERMVQYSLGRISFEPFVEKLCEAVRSGDYARARSLAGKRRHPLAQIARTFLDCVDKPREIRQELLQREGGLLLETVEKRLPVLRLIVQIAPILGLLGTVHGLLLAFWDLEEVTGPIRPSDIAGGIGSALTTTVFGLTIAIPASAFLLLFEEKVDRAARRMGFLVSHLEEALLESQESGQNLHAAAAEKRAG
ncbi:MAG: MotA/TolQ/ExbB proton channel family protein [Planctomycetota bacterium]